MTLSPTRLLAPLVVGLIGLTLWTLTVDVLGIGTFFLPGPGEVVTALGESWAPIRAAFWVTAANALWGLAAGAVLGVALAGVAAATRLFDGMLGPLVAIIAVIPIVAIAPLLYTMLGTDQETPRRIIGAIAAFVPVFVNTLRGLRQTTPLQRDLMRTYAAGPVQRFRTVTLPVAVPYTLTGLRLAGSLAVISALVAEYFGGVNNGLGSAIKNAATSNHARAFAYVGGAIVLGLLVFALTAALERLARRAYPSGESR
ncbi:ABC transporter permease [Nocardioides sp. NPDC101246]|uniref:ABC transporter permease n=1 Tax=Nocardioides sp. NPDC101246 TaxID=3364336 RepID=UPI0037FDB460